MRLQPWKADFGLKALFREFEASSLWPPGNFALFCIHSIITIISLEITTDVVLYGFGRIGRLLARELMTRTGQGNQMRLRAVVTRDKVNQDILEKRASLLQYDSVHGDFPGIIQEDYENKALHINGQMVQMIASSSPRHLHASTGCVSCPTVPFL